MFNLAILSRLAVPSRRPRPSVAPTALAADTRGVAALELALTLPFMMLLMMGVFDFGSYAYDTMQVNTAAYAGAEAAVAAAQTGQACTTALITTAEKTATPLGANITTSGTGASQSPNCAYSGYVNAVTNNAGSATYALSTTCPSGTCAAPGSYAVAYAQTSFSPVLSWSGLVLPKTISTTAMVRFE